MVAYKLMLCLFELTGKGMDLKDELLMFAGFATVGDVMELKDENRIAVRFALDQMKITSNQGMKCLIDIKKIDRDRLSPYHIGFILGPCINATGRLDTPVRALEMFMKQNHKEALLIAEELSSLNDSRKDLTEEYTGKAIQIVETDVKYAQDKVLVVYMPDCHESLAGIIAGRLREKYSKPAFVLTDGEDSVKGSGRSVEAYDMHAEMTKCADLFIKFGGHKAAAGLSIEKSKIPEMRKRLNDNCMLTEEEMAEKITADIALPLSHATFALAGELDKLQPYGVGNPKPLFAQKDLTVSDIRVIGKNRNAVKMKLSSDASGPGKTDAICFGDGDEIERELRTQKTISVMYELGINEYNGQSNVQLTIKDWK